MAPLILVMLVHFLVAVDGAAYPAPTPAARLDKRQVPQNGVSTIWSPFVVGTTVSYGSFGLSSATVTTLGNNWNWCPVGIVDCSVMTTCISGTIFYPGTFDTCTSTADVCGTEYLYSTIGANFYLTRFACYSTADDTRTFLLVSPTVGPISTTTIPTTSNFSPTTGPSSRPGPTSATPIPIPPPSQTPIGAIVGGVVGGLAVLAVLALAILLLLRRRNQQPAPAQLATEVVQQQHSQQPPPTAPYNPKYASYASNSPTTLNSQLPMYQYTAGQNETSYTPLHVPPTQEPANTTHSYARNLAPSPVGTGMSGAPYQPQDGNTHYTTEMVGAVEMNADQAQR